MLLSIAQELEGVVRLSISKCSRLIDQPNSDDVIPSLSARLNRCIPGLFTHAL